MTKHNEQKNSPIPSHQHGSHDAKSCQGHSHAHNHQHGDDDKHAHGSDSSSACKEDTHDHAHNHQHDDGHDHKTADHSGCAGHSHDHKHDHGQDDEHDHSHEQDDEHDHDHKHDACCSSSPIQLQALAPQKLVDGGVLTTIRIMQMDCPTEEALISKKLGGMSSVKSLEFNLMQRILTVVHEPDALESVLTALRDLSFQPEVANADSQQSTPVVEPQKPLWPIGVAVVTALASEIVGWIDFPVWSSALLAVIAIAFCGLGTYKKGWIAIRNGNLNINALMSIAVTGALILQHWPEAAMVMTLFTLAELIEAKSLDRARNAIQKLMQLAPESATVQQADGSWVEVDPKQIKLNSIVRVKPGERIALDGKIVNGYSTVDQAPITGESLPIEKTLGDFVFAGTINQTGSFDYQVTAAANNTTLSRIIHAVEQAQGKKAPMQRFVDQFSKIYTPIIFALAVAIAIIPPLFIDGNWYDWVYKALVLLVIACPCALVISTPVTIVSGLANAAQQGILIKGGVYLERGRKLTWLALDKTGTITHGKPVQTSFELRSTLAADDCRRLAGSLAGRSDHPVSQAVAKAASSDGITFSTVDDFKAILGRGVSGIIDGKQYYLGNHRLVEELNRCSPELEQRLEVLERSGQTVVMLIDEQQVLGLFAVADSVKKSSRDAIADLHQLGIKTLMLTGDNQHTAEAIAKEVNIDQVRGNQLPEDKLNAIESFSQQGVVGMVGDGINDAPALARADIGFAMGAMGTDTAIETADVALMDDDLGKIAKFIRLSKNTHQILIQNITLALGIKAVFLVLTLMGLGTMWMAVFADLGASLLVVVNGLRLLKK